MDLAYKGELAVGAAVVLDRKSLKLVDWATYTCVPKFPYIPTLLGFREVLPSWAALRRLKTDYDVLLVDGNGRLHPYKAGFACHLGVMVDKPTIGVAKRLLCGTVGKPLDKAAPIYLEGQVIGMEVKTLRRGRPIYVSVGHKISLETAVKLVLSLTRRGRKLPEPILQAHLLARRIAKSL